MIQQESRLKAAGNTGTKKLLYARILGGSKRRHTYLGDIIVTTVKDAIPGGNAKKGRIAKAVVVRTAKEHRHGNGSYIKFGNNATVTLKSGGKPRDTRILSPVARELREKRLTHIAPLATGMI